MPTFDIAINHGRVVDVETNFDAVRNVGIKDGKIAAITEATIDGAETIDATGHVVTAGFIDTHFHWVRPIGFKLALRDGCTTAMDCEFGALGTAMEKWYQDRLGKSQINYGTTVSHELARSLVLDRAEAVDCGEAQKSRGAGMNWAIKRPTLEEGNQILQILDEGLRAGAIGLGSTVGYMRAGVTAREMYEAQRVAANYGRLVSVHLRSTPGTSTTEPNGAQEILSNALALGQPAIICHFNNPGWQMIHELLVDLRQQGHNVWGEIYPYAAGATTLNAVFLKPDVWLEQLGYRYEDTLLDPATNTFFTRETYEETLRKAPATIVVVFKMPKEDIVSWLKLPGVTMGSDAVPVPGDWPWDTPYEQLGNTHPRTSGARAASLRLAKENDIPLMQVLAQLSYNSAKYLGDAGLESMRMRGRMQEGMVADITIFDPDSVKDNSTYAQGTLPSTGIPYVIVNGTMVVQDSVVLKDVNPGQPIQYQPEAHGRFQPLSFEKWAQAFLVSPEEWDLGGLAAVTPK